MESYDRVRITTDRLQADAVHKGMIGYIIEVYPDGNFEVEISRRDGSTAALVVVRVDEVEPAPEPAAPSGSD